MVFIINEDLLKRAKDGDQKSKEQLLESYTGAMIKIVTPIYLVGYTKEDLLQQCRFTFLYALDKFDLARGPGAFTNYVIISMKNSIAMICRKVIKERLYSDYSIPISEINDSNDAILDAFDTEDFIIRKCLSNNLKLALATLSTEEYQLIKELFISDERTSVLKYSLNHNISYYQCQKLRDSILYKLKELL